MSITVVVLISGRHANVMANDLINEGLATIGLFADGRDTLHV